MELGPSSSNWKQNDKQACIEPGSFSSKWTKEYYRTRAFQLRMNIKKKKDNQASVEPGSHSLMNKKKKILIKDTQ